MDVDPKVLSKMADALIAAWPTLAWAALVAAGAFLSGGWRARRKFYAQIFDEERSEVYKAVRADFTAIRLQSARDMDDFNKLHESPLQPPQWSDEHRTVREREAVKMTEAINHLRQIALVGPAELSCHAIGVIQQFLAWLDGDDHSDGDGIHHEWDHYSAAYLLEFDERRLVDLGVMSAPSWYWRRAKRSISWKRRALLANHWWLSIAGIQLHRRLQRAAQARKRSRLASGPSSKGQDQSAILFKWP